MTSVRAFDLLRLTLVVNTGGGGLNAYGKGGGDLNKLPRQSFVYDSLLEILAEIEMHKERAKGIFVRRVWLQGVTFPRGLVIREQPELQS